MTTVAYIGKAVDQGRGERLIFEGDQFGPFYREFTDTCPDA